MTRSPPGPHASPNQSGGNNSYNSATWERTLRMNSSSSLGKNVFTKKKCKIILLFFQILQSYLPLWVRLHPLQQLHWVPNTNPWELLCPAWVHPNSWTNCRRHLQPTWWWAIAILDWMSLGTDLTRLLRLKLYNYKDNYQLEVFKLEVCIIIWKS